MYKEILYEESDDLFNDSEFETIENSLSQIELVDHFLHSETETIIDLFYNINGRFNVCSPFFLDYLEVYHLSNFITNHLFFSHHKINYNNNIIKNLFRLTYITELKVTYDIISEYLYQFKINLDFNEWVLFCIKYTDLSELNFI